MNKREKELLNWAITNSVVDVLNDEKNKTTVDEELMEAVLGKSDPKRMKECVEAAVNDAFALHVRLDALDELEMLVESIDNAMDMGKIQLWQPLMDLLNRHEDADMKKMCLWVMGTAAQNNPQAQEALNDMFVLENSFKLLQHEHEEVKKKAFYVISAMSKPKGSPGHAHFLKLDGLATLNKYKEDEVLREKIEFLLDFYEGEDGI